MLPSLTKRSTLVDQVTALLRRGISEGQWSRSLPSERELSVKLQISRQTLRHSLKVLADEGLISSQTRAHWLIKGAGSRSRKTNAVVAMLSATPPEQWESHAVLRVDRLRGYLAGEKIELVYKSGRRYFATQHHLALAQMVRKTNAACWILRGAPVQVQRWFVDNRIPAVAMEPNFPGLDLPSIDLDFQAVARHATGLLLARGHRRIALLVSKPLFADDHYSLMGFQEALERVRLPPGDWVVSHDGTASGVRRMLDRAFRAKPPPTAIIAPARWTLVALFHLAQQGILAGQHYACVARDDDALLDLLSPSVARYGFDPVMFARRLFAATMRLTQHRHVQDQVRLLPQYLPGDSVDCQGFGKPPASR